MNNYEIKYAKEKYDSMLEEKNKVDLAKIRLKRLEQTSEVKTYLEIIEFLKNNDKYCNKQEMLYASFSKVATLTTNSNNILVYMGAYKINNLLALVLSDEKDADFICYEDLETENLYKINPISKKEFEEEHNIIYLDTKNYNEGIKKLRIQFFKQLLNKPQEEVVKKLIKGK